MSQISNHFPHPIPTYNDLLQTVSGIEQLFHLYQSEIRIDIIRHCYPYVVQVFSFGIYLQFNIHTLQHLLQMHHAIQQMLLSPF